MRALDEFILPEDFLVVKKIIAVLLIGLLSSACAPRSATFLSEPAGARVFINGEAVGQTPCAYQYPLGSGGSYHVTIEKEGYEAVRHLIRADETDLPARNRWLAAGIVWSPLWLGTLFTKKLKDGYEFVLKRSSPSLTARAESPLSYQ